MTKRVVEAKMIVLRMEDVRKRVPDAPAAMMPT
jgi:hypothetical protein